MLRGSQPTKFENWVCVMERGTEYEIRLTHNYLAHLEIPSNVLSKRDSSYSLNHGEMSMVYLYVPKEYEMDARAAIKEFLDESRELPDDPEADNGGDGS
ncbi:MAG TPA: hypothetical protein VK040_00295 [Balneolaceae bacterium]|nr:hypothetical protein [Balneolaceae bacterium]